MIPEIENLDEPFQVWSCSLAIISQQNFIQQLNRPFEALTEVGNCWKNILAEKRPWLFKTEEALTVFKKNLEAITGISGICLSLHDAGNRVASGFVTEIWVIIPESNRALENCIYETFRLLLAKNNSLLFEPHIMKLRGRDIRDVVPESFWSI